MQVLKDFLSEDCLIELRPKHLSLFNVGSAECRAKRKSNFLFVKRVKKVEPYSDGIANEKSRLVVNRVCRVVLFCKEEYSYISFLHIHNGFRFMLWLDWTKSGQNR